MARAKKSAGSVPVKRASAFKSKGARGAPKSFGAGVANRMGQGSDRNNRSSRTSVNGRMVKAGVGGTRTAAASGGG